MGRYEPHIGYRAGPVEGKTEYICQFTGGSRSTGYHGTGYYFCKDWKNCAGLNHGERPLYKLTFKNNVNWFRGTLETHSLLKKIQAFVVNYPIIKTKEMLDNHYWLAKHGLDIKGYDMDEIDSIKDRYDFDKEEYELNNFSEWLSKSSNYDVYKFTEDLRKIPELKIMWEMFMEDEPDWESIKTIKNTYKTYFDFDYIDGMRTLYTKLEFELPFEFDMSMDEFLEIAEKLHSYYERNKNKQEDSIPTKFLKMLGFDGVWPSNEIDNTTYGGVVFEKDSIEKIELLSEFAKDFKESKSNTKYNMRKIREDYSPDLLAGLVNDYCYDYSPKNHEEIWWEIKTTYKNEELANDVLAELEDSYNAMNGGEGDGSDDYYPGIYESKDYKYKAQIGDRWLKKSGKGYKLVKNKNEADIFESETEPRQIFNQMKKDGEIEKGVKIKFSKLKESADPDFQEGYDSFIAWDSKPHGEEEPASWLSKSKSFWDGVYQAQADKEEKYKNIFNNYERKEHPLSWYFDPANNPRIRESFDFEDEDDLGYDDFDYDGEMEDGFDPNVNGIENAREAMWMNEYEDDLVDTGIPVYKRKFRGDSDYLSDEYLDMVATDDDEEIVRTPFGKRFISRQVKEDILSKSNRDYIHNVSNMTSVAGMRISKDFLDSIEAPEELRKKFESFKSKYGKYPQFSYNSKFRDTKAKTSISFQKTINRVNVEEFFTEDDIETLVNCWIDTYNSITEYENSKSNVEKVVENVCDFVKDNKLAIGCAIFGVAALAGVIPAIVNKYKSEADIREAVSYFMNSVDWNENDRDKTITTTHTSYSDGKMHTTTRTRTLKGNKNTSKAIFTAVAKYAKKNGITVRDAFHELDGQKTKTLFGNITDEDFYKFDIVKDNNGVLTINVWNDAGRKSKTFEIDTNSYQRIGDVQYSWNESKKRTGRINEFRPSKFRYDLDKQVSNKERWNLKMDIESLKKKLTDLQNTTSELPDEYVSDLCDTDSYPFDEDIDNETSLGDWCNEVDDFLSNSLKVEEKGQWI